MSDYERIRVLFCDHLNLARGKYVPARNRRDRHATAVRRGLRRGLRACLDPRPRIGRARGPAGHGSGVSTSTGVRPGWEPGTGVVVADLEKEGSAAWGSAQGARSPARLPHGSRRGSRPSSASSLRPSSSSAIPPATGVPYDTPGAYVYGTGTAVDPAGLVDDYLVAGSRPAASRVEAINSEFDWPQFEFTLRYRDALGAIDDIFLFRLMAREVAAKRGYLLTFMPKPLSDRGGSGVHLNLSFGDKDGNNACADPAQEDGLSELARQCIAGLMHHHRSMAGLIAPTVNSYRRLRPASLAGYWANWGYDHRGVAVRVPGERGPATRIEHRVADGAANPYVAAAAVLQAARLGVETGLSAAAGGDRRRAGERRYRRHRAREPGRGARRAGAGRSAGLRHRRAAGREPRRDQAQGVGRLPRQHDGLGDVALPSTSSSHRASTRTS